MVCCSFLEWRTFFKDYEFGMNCKLEAPHKFRALVKRDLQDG
jgi:hypothetical protein